MKKILYASLLILFFNQLATAQTTPVWVNSISGTGDNSDRYNAMVQDGAANLYLGGYTFNTGKDKDYLLVKMTAAGDTLWTRQYNGAGFGADKIFYMALDPSGNIIVTGESDGGGINQNDILTQKYSAAGALLWSVTYNYTPFNQDDSPLGLAVDNSGNIFITGSSDRDSTAVSNDDIITLKYNASGILQWSARVNGTGNATDRGNGIVADNAGGCVITGRTASLLDDDIITILYSSAGAETWRTVYNRGFGNDRGEDICADGTGFYYVTGRSSSASDYDAVTIKYNASGVAQWTKFFNKVDNDYGNHIKVTAAGDVFVIGQSDVDNSGGTTDYDFLILKYNSLGTQQWAKTFGNPALNAEDPNDLAIDASGNVYVTGKSDVNALAAVTADNFLTVKYNASGVLQWSTYFDGTAVNSDDIAEAMVLDASGNLYIAGGGDNASSQKDASVIKYAGATGVATWTKNYNGKGDFSDKVQDMIADAANNIYVTGYVFSPEQRKDLFTAKINAAGTTLWYKTYDFSLADDEGKAITLDTSGNVYVCGNSIGNGTSDDYITIKYDALGNMIWSARYNFVNEADVATSISVNAANGNVFVTGYSDANSTASVTNYDIATVKYSSIGNENAVVRYNGSGNGIDRGVRIIVNGNSSYVTGKTWNGSDYDIVTIKYNGSLSQQWASVYAGNGLLDDEPRDMIQENVTGDLFVAGNTGTVASGDNYLTLRYKNAGALQWSSSYNGTGNSTDRAYGVVTVADGVFVTGRSAPAAGADSADIVTVRYDKLTGTQSWINRYNGAAAGTDRGNAITADAGGNIFVTGESIGAFSGSDYVTLLYDATGNRKWEARYNGTGNNEDVPRCIVADASGYVYVSGYATGTTSGFDATTLKYCPPPPVSAGADVSICKGASVNMNATGAVSYLWTPSTGLSSAVIANPVASPAITTTYVVSGTNALGCSAGQDTVKVIVKGSPTAKITAGGPLSFCQGDSVILSATAGTGFTYQWKKGSAIIAGATNISYTAKTAGTYKVTITNSNGCSNTSKGTKVQIICKEGVIASPMMMAPNPFENNFTIQLPARVVADIAIFDVLGRKTEQYFRVSNILTMGEHLLPGTYLIQVNDGEKRTTCKIVKTGN
ncbi:MAG: SBBP repeat-containing protein [Chitinophagales bacterium]|nr:SBBP repeat-containing protein [Chitinophagales bacterium]